MSKQQRHKLKKIERARWHRAHRKTGAAALGAAAAIAAGTQAYAAPIRFDNPPGPGHFDWIPSSPADVSRTLNLFLDASGQSPVNDVREPLFRQVFGGVAQSGAVGASGLYGFNALETGGPYGVFLTSVSAGSLIPSGAAFSPGAYTYYPGVGSQIPSGGPQYLGVRFQRPDGNHYGWIGVNRTNVFLDAFAWGYETTPGVPIAAGVPEPGTLALLVFGAAGFLTKRRRTA